MIELRHDNIIITSLLQSHGLGPIAAGRCPAFSDTRDSEDPAAIEFDPGLPWLNVSRPLTLKDLRGKAVILDFWTYGCINCVHVLEDLKRLEQKYPDHLVVIGVHTPKFDNEQNIDTLRRIVVRYDIEHPVVNDVTSLMARQYRMRAWPTQYVIDPRGRVLGRVVGEDNFAILDQTIARSLKQHASILDDKPLPIALEKDRFAASLLAAPGKIAVSDRYVAISDTLHHRIILSDRQGRIQAFIGGRASANSPKSKSKSKSGPVYGLRDGSYSEARFRSPQGLVFSATGLYVADTGNHAIRHIDLDKKRVSTVAGNGRNEIHRGNQYPATEIGLRSPWALALDRRQLYIAMAGIHQIWRLDLDRATIGPYAGSGREGIDDGTLETATFSQPSGLSLLGDQLYIADAEDSALRRINIRTEQVETLVGSGLFDFGDRDGRLSRAKLQHLLGVAAVDPQHIYVADTYNHKLKLAELDQDRITTVAGNGKPGSGTTAVGQLNEPGGIAVLGKTLLIADTNNNRIMQYHIDTHQLHEWPLSTR